VFFYPQKPLERFVLPKGIIIPTLPFSCLYGHLWSSWRGWGFTRGFTIPNPFPHIESKVTHNYSTHYIDYTIGGGIAIHTPQNEFGKYEDSKLASPKPIY